MPSFGRRSWGPLRGVSQLSLCVVLAGCAGAAQKPSPESAEIRELRAQLDAQSSLVAQQQRRLEDLEVKLAAISARQQQPAPAAQQPQQQQAAPAPKEPRPQLKTVKLGSGRRKPTTHLADSAPPVAANVELREPDDDQMARLDVDPGAVKEFDADRQWAQAVSKLNNGDHKAAEQEFLAFAAAHPQHSAADNALYLAGLVREARGDCSSALPLFEAVPKKYPAGDAVPMAQLERGRCLQLLGKGDDAKKVLQQLVRDHEGAPEAQQAKLLLLN
jgi:TolA-binding protein